MRMCILELLYADVVTSKCFIDIKHLDIPGVINNFNRLKYPPLR